MIRRAEFLKEVRYPGFIETERVAAIILVIVFENLIMYLNEIM